LVRLSAVLDQIWCHDAPLSSGCDGYSAVMQAVAFV
jgi:hypothetical protein